MVLELENELFRSSRHDARKHAASRRAADELIEEHRRTEHRALLSRLAALFDELTGREDDALLSLYGEARSWGRFSTCQEEGEERDGQVEILPHETLRELLFDLHDLALEEPARIRVSLLADGRSALRVSEAARA